MLLIDHLAQFVAHFFLVTPPERPTAPKPGQQQQLPAAAFGLPPDMVLGMPGSLGQPSVMGMPQMPSSEAPKLKDFLPFMKPGSFGPKAQVGSRASTVSNDCAPGSAGSLPASVSASPVHLPQAPVSFPPSPQRHLPASVSTSNGYGEVAQAAGVGFVHADAGYPVAEALLSPTAPPGAPRSASPAQQQPATVAHPGGPAEGQQLSRPTDMSHNIPQNFSQSSASVGSGMLPMSASSGGHAGGASVSYAGVNGYSLSSQSGMQVTGQPLAVNALAYSGPNFIQPGMHAQSGVHTQHDLPNNTSSFESRVGGQSSVLPSNAAPPSSVLPNTSAQPSGLQYSGVGNNMGSSVASANWNQSYPGGNVAAGNVQQPNIGTPIAGVPVHQGTPIPGVPGHQHTHMSNILVRQVNNPNNALGQFSSADGSQPSNIDISKPQYYQTPLSVPPASAAVQMPYQSVQPRPPSYEAVTQQYPPPLTQPMNVVFPSTQPGFTDPPPNGHVQPGLSSAQMQAPYHGVSTVRPDVPYGSMHSGHLAVSSQQPATGIHPQHTVASQPQQPPSTHQIMPGSQRPLAPAPQHPVMPVSSSYMEQQPQHMSQNQPRYPVPNQTVPGLPVPGQHPGMIHATSQTPKHPGNVQMPATQSQLRYPTVPNTSYSYPTVAPQLQPTYQNTGQQPVASQMQPMHSAASHRQPAVTNQQQHYQQYPVQPNRPEMGHTPGYLPGSQPQPRYPGTNQIYQDPGQPTSAYHQPPSVTSQQLHYQSSTAQQQSYHPGSSQPPVVNQSATVAPQTPHSNQQQPHTSAPYNPNVNTAPGEMQAFADIPVCLPSPLQPSRVNAVEVSKNVDSLRDLDLSGGTSSASDAQIKQTDSSAKPSDVDSTDSKDVVIDSSTTNVDEQREKEEEEARRTLHQSRSSRDIFADSDTMARFVAEVEKFQKHVDSLVKPTLGGYFPLDKEWKVSFCLQCTVTSIFRYVYVTDCICALLTVS